MTTAGRGQVWTGEQLSARLAALGGVAPEATHHAVYWTITGPGPSGHPPEGYAVPGEAECLTPASFDFWLAQRGLAGLGRLGIVVLVIRTALTPDGGIDTCALEYRRGAVDGPYHGSPARITFTGPARDVRFYQAAPDGQLREIAPTPSVKGPSDQGSDDGDTGWGIVTSALAAWFDAPVLVIGTRAPTVIEAMVGIARVLHLERPGAGETGCGVLWHGPIPVALPAAFPRFDVAPRLAPAQQLALAALIDAEHLVVCETRRDDQGLAVLARRGTTREPVLVRFDGAAPRIAPYVPGLPSGLLEAQAQWVRYIETYEHLCARDAYRDGDTGALIVLTQGSDGKRWRHSVDEDGVETWRTAEPGTAEEQPRDRFPQPPAPGDSVRDSIADGMAPGTQAPPFGDQVDRRFPAAAYDIHEAALCLAQGRSTAAVFHTVRIITHGLDAYAAWRGEPNPPRQRGEQRWRVLLRWMRDDHAATGLHAALDAARAAWRGASLQVAAKYTETEAQHIFAQAERFMRAVAALCDEDGVPASELDDGAR